MVIHEVICDVKYMYEVICMAGTSKFAAYMEGSWETAFDLSASEIVDFLLKSTASAGLRSLSSYGHNWVRTGGFPYHLLPHTYTCMDVNAQFNAVSGPSEWLALNLGSIICRETTKWLASNDGNKGSGKDFTTYNKLKNNST